MAARPIRRLSVQRGTISVIIWPMLVGWRARATGSPGTGLSYADLSAAAHLSAADYLGDVPWNEDETAKDWYARVTSRPSFRSILAETVAGIRPSPTYADLDF